MTQDNHVIIVLIEKSSYDMSSKKWNSIIQFYWIYFKMVLQNKLLSKCEQIMYSVRALNLMMYAVEMIRETCWDNWAPDAKKNKP